MNKSKIKWGGFSLIIAFLSIWAIISQSRNFSPQMLLSLLINANKFWLFMAFLSTFGFIWFEGFSTVRIAKRLGYYSSKLHGTLYGAADVYFSSITPSASGGQPASAYFMLRDGMSGPAVTTTLLLNLIMYSIALFLLGIPGIVFGKDIFYQFSLISKLLIIIGSIVLLTLVIAFFLLLFKGEILYAVCNYFLHFLEKIHLLRHAEEKRQKLNHTMEDYKRCAGIIAENKLMLLEALVLNIMQRLSQLGVSFFLFLAMKKGIWHACRAMIVQYFVALGSNSVPVPGGMGVADYIMLDGMEYLVGKSQTVQIELLCRGVTFYSCVLLGAMIVLIGYISGIKRKDKRI